MGEANDALRAELAGAPVPSGGALVGEYDGLLAALAGALTVQGGRAGTTLTDVLTARRLFRVVTALGLEGRLFVGHRAVPSRRHPAGMVERVTWAWRPAGPSGRGLGYARAFVRAATLAVGYLGDPRGGYDLEWNFAARAAAHGSDRRLAHELKRLGAVVGQAAGRRGAGLRLYVKGGEAVGDLLVQLGAGESLLEWENARALRAMRGRIHREVNAETANLRRAARAGVRQAEVVRTLVERRGDELPAALLAAARARIDRPEASLEELAQVLGLSKSGTNQRMRRLMALAAASGLGGNAGGACERG